MIFLKKNYSCYYWYNCGDVFVNSWASSFNKLNCVDQKLEKAWNSVCKISLQLQFFLIFPKEIYYCDKKQYVNTISFNFTLHTSTFNCTFRFPLGMTASISRQNARRKVYWPLLIDSETPLKTLKRAVIHT